MAASTIPLPIRHHNDRNPCSFLLVGSPADRDPQAAQVALMGRLAHHGARTTVLPGFFPAAWQLPLWSAHTIGPMRFFRLLPSVLLAVLVCGCALPPLEGRSNSAAMPASTTERTPLGLAAAHLRAQEQAPAQVTGITPLDSPREAFAARHFLARSAVQTLDVQYYIWRPDTSGLMLLGDLLAAADRGVRVRLLLDDGGTGGMDTVLHTLDTHPNIEVRLFNPFVLRWPKVLGYLFDFQRTNRRMHNKSFTADNQASIVGGRNIGNEYFGSPQGVLFADLDVLTLGPAVQDISQDFDRYWASASAYPIGEIVTVPYHLTMTGLRQRIQAKADSAEGQRYQQALAGSRLLQDLAQQDLNLLWAPTHLVSDDPAKVLGQAHEKQLIGAQLAAVIGNPTQSVDLVSPYFVPTQAGVDALAQMREQGIRIRVLTNALEATDVSIVHAGYARYRVPLLRMGVDLYELRRQAPPQPPRPLHERVKRRWLLAGSGTSLHAKTFAIDGQRAFVGSFNFDPRSMLLNTEMGLMIESPTLAQQISNAFEQEIPWRSYRLGLDAQEHLQWEVPPPGSGTIYRQEPNTGWFKRWGLWLLQRLPLEPLL